MAVAAAVFSAPKVSAKSSQVGGWATYEALGLWAAMYWTYGI